MSIVDCSFIIAARNMETFVESAIISALEQTDKNIEIIVIDDDSSDGTADIVAAVAAHDSRIKLVRNLVQEGAAGARNRGLDLAQGRWVAVLDADDTMAPDRLETLLRLASLSGADILADNIAWYDSDDTIQSQKRLLRGRKWRSPRFVDVREYLTTNRVTGGSSSLGFLKPIFSRELLLRHAIRYDPALRIGEDFDLCLRCLLNGARFFVTPEAKYHYRVRSGSLCRSLSTSDVRAMLSAHQRLQAMSNCGGSVRRAHAAYGSALKDGLAYVEFREALRAQNIWYCLRCALRPRLWRGLMDVTLGAARRAFLEVADGAISVARAATERVATTS